MEKLHPVMRELMARRGITSEEDIEEYLSPRPRRTYDPFLMEDMRGAVDTIIRAAESDTRVCVYGDYDCDGVASVTLLLDAFSRFMDPALTDYYIPSRFTEGYGLNKEAIKKIADRGTGLLVTVDCGCSSVEEVGFAKSLGMDVIVTDHHIVPEKRPDCLMLDPKRPDCGYPFKGLAGCGVAYKLVQALQRTLGLDRKLLADDLDIVGIATIGDIVPLVDENRTIAKYGIDRIHKTGREGLKALISSIQMKREEADSSSVSFGIVPNINANGRMGDASAGVRLLSTKDAEEARELARETAANNSKGKRLQEDAIW